MGGHRDQEATMHSYAHLGSALANATLAAFPLRHNTRNVAFLVSLLTSIYKHACCLTVCSPNGVKLAARHLAGTLAGELEPVVLHYGMMFDMRLSRCFSANLIYPRSFGEAQKPSLCTLHTWLHMYSLLLCIMPRKISIPVCWSDYLI